MLSVSSAEGGEDDAELMETTTWLWCGVVELMAVAWQWCKSGGKEVALI